MTAKQIFGGWKWILILVALALAAGAWFLLRQHDPEIQYQTSAVTRGDLTNAVTATGTLNPVVNVTVGSQVSGNIAKLMVDYNSLVKSNQIVAQLDPAIFEANVAQAEGDLANAKANEELMQIQAKRADELFKSSLIAESDHDTAIANLHQAEALVKIKQATLSNAQINLAHCTIYAPVDGIVISRNVDVGQTVAASLSAPTIFVIAGDLTKMQIDSNVSEADIGTIEEGQPVQFTVDAFPNRVFDGKVVQIRNSPTTVQNVVTYDVVISVNNPDMKLRPGMTANASIITAQRNGIFKIPNSAFRFKPPEASTNVSFLAKMFATTKPAAPAPATNAPASGTNKIETASAEPPLTGNEPPDELQRRVRAMRERGDEVPAAIRAKLREYYQSGVLQRPAEGSGSHTHSSPPAWRTVYILTTSSPDGQPVPKAVRVKTGITDNITTEVVEGLNEGDALIVSAKFSQNQSSAAAASSSPFGGPSMMPRR